MHEEIDLNELFSKESKDIDDSKKSTNRLISSDSDEKRKKKNKDSVSSKVKSIALKSVLPSVVTGLVCFVIGGVIFSGDDQTSVKVQQAKTIKSSSTVLENLNSVKDSQIESLKKQLSEMITTDSSGNQILSSNGQNVNHLAFTKDVNAAATGGIDEFFTKLISINPTASDSELQALQQDLTKYMTDASATSELYSTLTGGSAAKELGKKTTKISSATVTLARSDSASHRTYLVVVPISTPKDEKIYNAFYIVQMTNDYKIDYAKYAGYSSGAYYSKIHELYKSVEEVNEDLKAEKESESESE